MERRRTTQASCIPPDIHLAATPRDLLGETDTVLDAAVRRLKETTQARSTPDRSHSTKVATKFPTRD
jgi:hypothetical protein